MTRTCPSRVTNVVGLEVTVDHARGVRRREPPARREEDLQHLPPGPRLGFHPKADGVPFDELHRDEDAVLKRADVVDDDDVRVRELRDGLRLTQQPQTARRIGGTRGVTAQQLHGDLSIQLGIVRGVDLAHSTPPHQSEHDVAADDRALRERFQLHRRSVRHLARRRSSTPGAGRLRPHFVAGAATRDVRETTSRHSAGP
jgi:hypothetical protein